MRRDETAMMATRAVTSPTSAPPPTPNPRPRRRMAKARQVVDDADVERLNWTIRQITVFWDQQPQLPSVTPSSSSPLSAPDPSNPSPTPRHDPATGPAVFPNVAFAPIAHPPPKPASALGKRCSTLSRSAFWEWCDDDEAPQSATGRQRQQQEGQGQRTACSPISTQAFWYKYQNHLEPAWQAKKLDRDSSPACASNEERNRKRRRQRAQTRTGLPQLKEDLLFKLEQEDSDSLAESKSRWLRTWLSTLPHLPETVWPSVFEPDGSGYPPPALTACVSPKIATSLAASTLTGTARVALLLPACTRTRLPLLLPLDSASRRDHLLCPSSDREEDRYSMSSLSTTEERIDDPGVSPTVDVDAPRRRKTYLTAKNMLRIAAAGYRQHADREPGPQHGSALALWTRQEREVYLDAATHDRLLRRLGDRTSCAGLARIAVVPPPSVCSTEQDNGNTGEAQSGRVDGRHDGAGPKVVIRPFSVRNDRWQTLWRGMFVRMPSRSSLFASSAPSSSSSSPGDVAVAAAEEEEEVLIGTRSVAPIAVDDEGDDHVQVGLELELALQNAWRLLPRSETIGRLSDTDDCQGFLYEPEPAARGRGPPRIIHTGPIRLITVMHVLIRERDPAWSVADAMDLVTAEDQDTATLLAEAARLITLAPLTTRMASAGTAGLTDGHEAHV